MARWGWAPQIGRSDHFNWPVGRELVGLLVGDVEAYAEGAAKVMGDLLRVFL
jgi:hypothetical protein